MSTPRTTLHLAPDELIAATRDDTPWTPAEPAVVVVPADEMWPRGDATAMLASAVIVGVTDVADTDPREHAGSPWCDVVLHRDDARLDAIVERVEQTPIAATALVQVLRGSERRSLEDGLLLESAVYSALQAGPEFHQWRASRPVRRKVEPDGPPVIVDREGDRLTITLNRPHVRNALNSAMRDGLVSAFRLAVLDDTITSVTLRGTGGDYSSGGDLDEFDSFSDPASAHLVRLTASVGRTIAAVAAPVRVELRGACLGSGIELPAFAGMLVAGPTTRIGLPELGLGLIPGAGGTWSLPRRIGRHRTALLALTGEIIDATTAQAWGLVTAAPATDPQ